MNSLLLYINENLLLVGATALTIVAVLLMELRLRSRSGLEVSVLQAVRMINNGAAVVDVRAPERYAAGHIVDAINMTPDELGKVEENRIKKKRGVLVVCDTGADSYRSAKALQSRGYTAAFCLGGGLSAWQKEQQLLVPGRK